MNFFCAALEEQHYHVLVHLVVGIIVMANGIKRAGDDGLYRPDN